MKRTLLLLTLLVPLVSLAQKPTKSQPPTILSMGDILVNYGLDSAWVNDTAEMMSYLNDQPQDYVALTNLCVSIRTKAQKAISSIENDYDFRDSLIWIDSNTIVADYPIYEYRLRRLADLMGRMSIRYSRLEQQRIEAEKEAARKRAIEEARRQQEERNQVAADLRSNIDLHHRAIIKACDGVGVTDKAKLKDLKDLYYSYLMVYNKYDLSTGNATNESIAKLDELNAFQNDLLENVLGQNSLPYQIDNFKNVLKVRCENGYNDIYRSYAKVFKHTTVPISFADVREYEDYINRMRTIINIQQRYLQTIDLRNTIAKGSEDIANRYGKKYKDVVSSYKEVVRTVNQVPSFTSNAESILFIQELEGFIAAQQRYLDDYYLLEEITHRSDSIVAKGTSSSKTYDVVSAYREVSGSLVPVPAFKNDEGADLYESQLDNVRQVQQCYLDVLKLRNIISGNDDTLNTMRRLDNILTGGYRLLRKQTDLRPGFSTVERGRSCIDVLNGHIEMQNLCLGIAGKIKMMKSNEAIITSKDHTWRNIAKSYSRMAKAYQGMTEITNLEDLRRYDRQCNRMIAMQAAYLELLRSSTVADADSKLNKETNIDKIKLIVGIN